MSYSPYQNLHKRASKPDFVNKNGDYDQEIAEYLEQEKNNTNENQQILNKKYNNIVKYFLSFALFLLIFGFYVDIFSSKSKGIENSDEVVKRKLKEDFNNCKREDFESVTKYVQCMAEETHILIISDTEEHFELKEKYPKHQIHFKHINSVFTNISDYLEFTKILEEKSPWIFVEGSYIGNEKELEYFHEHSILSEGMENSEIKPSLNENEVNLLSSSQIDEDVINILKVRQYLRRHLPSKEVDKEMNHIKHLISAHKNMRGLNDKVDKTESTEEVKKTNE